MLDAEGILRMMGIEAAAQYVAGAEIETEKKDEKQVLIFTCSGAEYFAVEMNEISRIEVINTRLIQEIGSSQFINIAGKTIQVIRPEDYTPVRKRRYPVEKLYVLTLKNSASPIGLIAGSVIDKVAGNFEFDDKQLCSDYIYGVSRFNEKILIFIKPEAIAQSIEDDKLKKKKHKQGALAEALAGAPAGAPVPEGGME